MSASINQSDSAASMFREPCVVRLVSNADVYGVVIGSAGENGRIPVQLSIVRGLRRSCPVVHLLESEFTRLPERAS